MEVRRRQMLRQLGEAETTHMLSSLTAIAMVVALREAAPLAGSLTQTRFKPGEFGQSIKQAPVSG